MERIIYLINNKQKLAFRYFDGYDLIIVTESYNVFLSKQNDYTNLDRLNRLSKIEIFNCTKGQKAHFEKKATHIYTNPQFSIYITFQNSVIYNVHNRLAS